MNAYFLDAGDIEDYCEYIAGYPRYEYVRVVDLIFAETRGKARAVFCKSNELEFTYPISIKIIEKNITREEGIAGNDDILWGRVDLFKCEEENTE